MSKPNKPLMGVVGAICAVEVLLIGLIWATVDGTDTRIALTSLALIVPCLWLAGRSWYVGEQTLDLQQREFDLAEEQAAAAEEAEVAARQPRLLFQNCQLAHQNGKVTIINPGPYTVTVLGLSIREEGDMPDNASVRVVAVYQPNRAVSIPPQRNEDVNLRLVEGQYVGTLLNRRKSALYSAADNFGTQYSREVDLSA